MKTFLLFSHIYFPERAFLLKWIVNTDKVINGSVKQSGLGVTMQLICAKQLTFVAQLNSKPDKKKWTANKNKWAGKSNVGKI